MLTGLRPQLDRHHLAHLEPANTLLRQADQHFPFAIGGQPEDRLPRRDHLPDLERALGDHPVLGRAQYRVAGLVVGHIELGADLLDPCFACAIEVLGVVGLGAADQLPVHQGLVAVSLGAHQLQVGFGCRHLGAHGFELQAHILWVELGQGLVGLDPVALFDQTPADLASDAKGQLRLQARAHLAGVAVHRRSCRLRLHHHGRAYAGRRDLFLPTSGQQQGQGDGQGERQGMAQHGERPFASDAWNFYTREYIKSGYRKGEAPAVQIFPPGTPAQRANRLRNCRPRKQPAPGHHRTPAPKSVMQCQSLAARALHRPCRTGCWR
ncbi:hypothetical protein D9M73_151210 [compost metagenome]